MAKKAFDYGSWVSPITADMIVAETVRLSQIFADRGYVYWVEMRPSEGGRNVIVRYNTETEERIDLTPSPFNVRSRAHEYGGGAYSISGEQIIFSNDTDQKLYKQASGSASELIPDSATESNRKRFADGIIDTKRNQYFCVVEDHSQKGNEPQNYIATIGIDTGETKTIVSGYDFYAAPRISPDGKKLAWLGWKHPDMPWDNTELWLADVLDDGSMHNPVQLTSGFSESVFQPEWSPDNKLFFVSDRSNWWNIYRWQDGEIKSVWQREAEFGLPMWIFGMSTYTFIDSDTIICTFFEDHSWHLARITISSSHTKTYELPFSEITGLKSCNGIVYFLAGSPNQVMSVVGFDCNNGRYNILHSSSYLNIPESYISQPHAIQFDTGGDQHSFAYYYPPRNNDFCGPEEQLPPLIVKIHGGPTGSTTTCLDWRIQYWTSRGFSVVDVNYSGSTGYGRLYRERLNGNWGLADVHDCIEAAKHLASQGFVDKEKTAIAGGSAGGYTVLSALTFHDYFKAGASYYGISDLETMTKDTHKFESRYLDKLVAPYPEARDVYIQRSPIYFTEKLTCPIILMQGLEDKIVPPDQAEKMLKALQQKGIPVAYLPFEGEQHGFRQASNIKRALEAELYFYARIFNFSLHDEVEPVHIYNLD